MVWIPKIWIYLNHLTWLSAKMDFIKFIRREFSKRMQLILFGEFIIWAVWCSEP